MEGQGRILDVVVGEELCGVACCLGSGIVVLKYSAIQRLKREIKQDTDRQTDRQTQMRFVFRTLSIESVFERQCLSGEKQIT